MKATIVTASGHILVMLLTEHKHKQRNSANHPDMHSHSISVCAPLTFVFNGSALPPVITQGSSAQPAIFNHTFCNFHVHPVGKHCINASFCFHHYGGSIEMTSLSVVNMGLNDC